MGYSRLGGRLDEKGAKFAVWAPNAKGLQLVVGKRHLPMERGSDGVWELHVEGVGEFDTYQFKIESEDGSIIEKSDPYAYYNAFRPERHSILFDVDRFEWNDRGWMESRERDWHKSLINIYEVHLGSWRRDESGHFRNYRDLAHHLADYVIDMGYSHVELMPVGGHPLDDSWGYQVSGFYSVTSRYGTPRDFQYFVNHLHERGIGVILDWVGAHFPTDTFALAQFDGTHLYEHSEMGVHPHWDTLYFDYREERVRQFLIENVLYWCEIYHIDGFRLDAVSSMIYKDFGKEENGEENPEAISMLQELNQRVHTEFPGVLTIAEESHNYEGVTSKLGFDFKWNIGWMNDVLDFFSTDFPYRKHKFHQLTFLMMYNHLEHYILEISHDEVVHEKKSLFSKMPGDENTRRKGLCQLMAFMMAMPGKKLMFMGAEIGQQSEWDFNGTLPWGMVDLEVQGCVRKLNKLYSRLQPLWDDQEGFKWLSCDDVERGILALKRGNFVAVFNFSDQKHEDHFSGFSEAETIFAREGAIGVVSNGGLLVELPPLSTLYIEATFDEGRLL